MTYAEVRELVRLELQKYDQGFEDRLSTAIRKALDTVLYEEHERIQAVETDLARLLRHTGLE